MLTLLIASFTLGRALQDEAPGRTFAFVVGINNYTDSGINSLRGAVADADAFANWLVQVAGVPASHVIELTSNSKTIKPTREVLLGACGLVQQWGLRKNDTLIVYYAGHAVDVQGNAYLIPVDGRKKASIQLGVTLDQIGRPSTEPTSATPNSGPSPSATDPQQLNWLSCEAFLSAIGQNAGTMIAFFDMCRGQAWNSSEYSVNKTLTTSILNSTNPGRLPADLAPTRIGILHSCSRDQTSEEDGDHGLFTAALTTGLKSASADANRDGKITYGELYKMLRSQITKETQGKQVPYDLEAGGVGDYVLATVKISPVKPPIKEPAGKGGGAKGNGGKGGTSGKTPVSKPPVPAVAPAPEPVVPVSTEKVAEIEEKSLYSAGNYSVLPGPRWIDLTSGEGGFTARIPDEDVSDPRLVRRVENKVPTPDGEVTSKTYVYEKQDGYAYRRYAATVLDYPMKINPDKANEQEKKILQFGKDLAAKKKKTPLDDLVLGNTAAATMLQAEITKLAGSIDVNKVLAASPLRPLSAFTKFIPGLGGNKGPQTLFQVGYPYNIGQHPGFRIEWRKVNEGFGILQIGVLGNRLYILSEIYAGGDGRMPSGVVPRLFVDSFMPTVQMIARPSEVIGFVGG